MSDDRVQPSSRRVWLWLLLSLLTLALAAVAWLVVTRLAQQMMG
jgi:hypothetical protein